MHAAAETAVRAGDNVFAADEIGELHDSVGDQLWVLEDVGRVADDAWDEHLALRELHRVAPDLPFVLVAYVAGLD